MHLFISSADKLADSSEYKEIVESHFYKLSLDIVFTREEISQGIMLTDAFDDFLVSSLKEKGYDENTISKFFKNVPTVSGITSLSEAEVVYTYTSEWA